jgi:predicted ester cyclase
MSDAIKKAIDTYYQAWNTGEVDLLDEVFAPEAIVHFPPYPDTGLAGFKQYILGMRAGYPDLTVRSEETLFDEDKTSCRYSLQGTFTGRTPMVPIPPTGMKATAIGCSMIRWRDGRAVENWTVGDVLGFLQQSGVIPPMG